MHDHAAIELAEKLRNRAGALTLSVFLLQFRPEANVPNQARLVLTTCPGPARSNTEIISFFGPNHG